jgi:DNA-binding XRE family transcriptional regulator
LGYVPFKHDGSIGDKLRWLRITGGWTQDDWGKAARVSPGTIGRWEMDRGTQDSPVIEAAIKTLSKHLEAAGLSSLAAPELVSVQTSDFRRPRNVTSGS